MPDPLAEHYSYLSDTVKLARYQAAIKQLLRPQQVVLDLGCGTGLLGLMALRAGARKVHFVEEGPIIEVARQAVTAAGFASQAEFWQHNSFELELPERVDLVLCDHVGYFGFDYGILALLADAKQRFLKPEGRIVPAEIELQLAPIEADACRQLIAQWRDGSVPDDYAWLAASAANNKHALQLGAGDLLAEPASLARLELGLEATPFHSWKAEFVCTRDGTLDAVAGWFDCRLADKVRMSNSPASDNALQRPQACLPLESPVALSEGDAIRVTVMARHLDHVLGWVVELPASGQRFELTTFNGLLLDRAALLRTRPDRTARLNRHGRARQLVLSYCDGKRTVAEVQALVQREHPDLFPSAYALSSFVTQVLAADTDA